MKNRNSLIRLVTMLVGPHGGLLVTVMAQSDGAVIGWGANEYGQTNVPTSLSNVVAVAGGGSHSLALKSDGTVVAWGAGLPGHTGSADLGQSTVPPWLTGVKSVAGGDYHSLALRSNGTVVAWGDNSYGKTNVPAWLSNVIAIAASGSHSLAAKADGTVVSWGSNYGGQTNVPTWLSNVIAVAAGSAHSVALKADGSVVAWGSNSSGQTNFASGLSSIVAIAAGGSHNLALGSDGLLNGLSNVNAIAVGLNHYLALTSEGKVTAWGGGYSGQDKAPANLSGVLGIAAGNNHNVTLVARFPRLRSPPTSQTVVAGFPAVFTVTVLGMPPLSYQWFFNGTNAIAGATGPSLQLPSVQMSQVGAYTVVITNVLGSTSSPPAILTLLAVPPGLLTQPRNQAFWTGLNVQFDVTTTGSLPLAFQWFFNGTSPIVGATNSTLQLTNVQPWQEGTYHVLVTNVYGSVTSAPASLNLVPANTVPMPDEALLRAAIATGENPVTFQCDGTITLSNTIVIATNTILDGAGHQLTISGADRVGVFGLTTNASLTLLNLTIADGQATSGGGASSVGGNLTASNCTFSSNVAQGDTNGPARGGAICSVGGNVALHHCLFVENRTSGAQGFLLHDPRDPPSVFSYVPGLDGYGGAVFSTGTLNVQQCIFRQNSAAGGPGGVGAPGGSDGATGSQGTAGGAGMGGAICGSGFLSVSQSLFVSNTVAGGSGGAGGYGGPAGLLWKAGRGGDGAAGGQGSGAAVAMGSTAGIINTTFAGNAAAGGAGGAGGSGGGAWNDFSSGGNGGNGGYGGSRMGALYGGNLALTNCTIASNYGVSGNGGAGGAAGMNMYPGHPIYGQPGQPGTSGSAFGGLRGFGALLLNTLLATNAPGGNCLGSIIDLGHNLSSDDSGGFSGPGSLNHTDPKLGALADNGGLTLTMALLPGSPALDGGDNAVLLISDQRGFPRPLGAACDIGAYENCYPAACRIGYVPSGGVDITVYGKSGQVCWLMTSQSLPGWQCIATNQINADGTVKFHDASDPGAACRFYRVAVP